MEDEEGHKLCKHGNVRIIVLSSCRNGKIDTRNGCLERNWWSAL